MKALGDEELKSARQVKASMACQLLDISRSTLERWMRAGIAPPYTRLPSGGLRFRIRDLEAFTKEGQHEV